MIIELFNNLSRVINLLLTKLTIARYLTGRIVTFLGPITEKDIAWHGQVRVRISFCCFFEGKSKAKNIYIQK